MAVFLESPAGSGGGQSLRFFQVHVLGDAYSFEYQVRMNGVEQACIGIETGESSGCHHCGSFSFWKAFHSVAPDDFPYHPEMSPVEAGLNALYC